MCATALEQCSSCDQPGAVRHCTRAVAHEQNPPVHEQWGTGEMTQTLLPARPSIGPREAPREFPTSRVTVSPAAQKNLLRRTDVTEHELDGELLIFDPVTSNTHRLNDTALFIWQSCDGTRDVGQVASALAAAYDVSADEAHGHVERLLNELSDKGLFAKDNEYSG